MKSILINLYIFYESFHMCTINTLGENPTSIYMCCMFACVCLGTFVHVWYASQRGRGHPEPQVANDPIPPHHQKLQTRMALGSLLNLGRQQ